MRTNVTLPGAVAALAGLLLASPAAASVPGPIICVTPATVLTCPFHTITAALASASPRQTIKVAPGTYYDNNLTIPASLDGLQIVGASKTTTVIDIGSNTALGIVSGGEGFVVNARNVVIKNMTVRNGARGLTSTAPGTIVTGMNFLGQGSYGVWVYDYGAQITSNEFHDSAYGAISGGFGTIFKGNTITNMSWYGIEVGNPPGGDQAQVSLNKVYNSLIGIYVHADGAQIKSNDVKYQWTGIVAQGAFPTVQLNRVFGSATGIESVCTPNCFGGSVASNQVTDATLVGIQVSSDAPGLFVQSNTILRAGKGVVVSNTAGSGNKAVFVVTNKATDIGNDPKGHCYSLTGDGNVAYKNQAKGCSGSGVYAKGNGNTLDGNVVTGGFENGLTVDGGGVPYSGAYVTNNKATGNIGQGITILGNAAGTTVQFNTASSNRKDFCDVNNNGTLAGWNSFSVPAGPVACDIVH